MLLQTQAEISHEEFKRISDLVYQHCKINLHDGKKELVQARLNKRLRGVGCETFAQYIALLQGPSAGNEFSALIDSISTNLTSFFRENNHFAYLAQRFLPPLAERKSKLHNRRFRCWSAGCSSGEEPYTIAMTLAETIGLKDWDIKILATDISHPVLKKAIEGIYPATRIEGVPPALLGKYFEREAGERFSVAKSLRDLITFRHLNLMDNWPFTGPFDFIFCRNVMIYFDKPTQQALVQRYWDCLDSGGVLFTGHSESLTGIEHRFKYVEPTIYMKP